MDFLSLDLDKSKTKDILVTTDHFTKYAVAVPTPNQKAKTVAHCLWENFFVHYGIPQKIHGDQGPDFESCTIKKLCALTGIQKIQTTPDHPRGNPVERFNRILLDMLGTLSEHEKVHWKDFVKLVVHAYNCTKHDTTRFAPYELMFGRQPRLPVDLAFGLPVSKTCHNHSEYVKHLKDNLEKSYHLASKNAEKIMQKNKTRFDRTVTASELNVGDRVLVRNVRLRGKHKIADKWESTIYVVVKKAENLPVYTLRPENADKPLRTLHRDLLLPCGYLPATSQIQPTPPTKSVKQVSPTPEDEIESSDEDILPLNWYEPLASEPVHFTTTVGVSRLPAVTTPATEPQPDMPQAPPVTPESVTEPEPAFTELKPQLQPSRSPRT